mmetsp:Transcript_877/g.1364  ORF Transcript_877/g.1364 Transcript_877/m.1364 type:complete len:245 (-) Transcript_877:38-772(-)
MRKVIYKAALLCTIIKVTESFTLTTTSAPSCLLSPASSATAATTAGAGAKNCNKKSDLLQVLHRRCRTTTGTCLTAQKADADKSDFWESQRILAESMSSALVDDDDDDAKEEGKATKLSEKEKYNKKVNDLVSETFYFGVIFFSAIWFVAPNPFTSISYLLGALLGTAYCYGLGKYVETLGGSAYDMEDVKGSGVGSARFAFLIVLFIFVGKFRSEGLQEIPAIMGFFTYQLSSLSQGLKESTE